MLSVYSYFDMTYKITPCAPIYHLQQDSRQQLISYSNHIENLIEPFGHLISANEIFSVVASNSLGSAIAVNEVTHGRNACVRGEVKGYLKMYGSSCQPCKKKSHPKIFLELAPNSDFDWPKVVHVSIGKRRDMRCEPVRRKLAQ